MLTFSGRCVEASNVDGIMGGHPGEAIDVAAATEGSHSGAHHVRASVRRPRLVAVADDETYLRLAPMREVRLRRNPWSLVFKAVFDRVSAAVGLVFFAVPMVVISLVIVATMGRPVLFRQRRVGRHGETFEVLKFRTMRPDRRQRSLDVIRDRRETHKTERDPRHTRIGRFLRRYSLDELPQLINVLRGEMSIVGPRPELESVVAHYRPGLDQRHLVAPGLTGLWQISARNDGPMHQNGEWDLEYVETVSLLTDLRILARTPAAMLGANAGS